VGRWKDPVSATGVWTSRALVIAQMLRATHARAPPMKRVQRDATAV
jgi:hypothetical protein